MAQPFLISSKTMTKLLFLVSAALTTSLSCLTAVDALPTLGSVTSIDTFTLPRAPSGMYYDNVDSSGGTGLLYVLCGTQTNGDHYLYTYTTDGTQKCLITIPQSVGMSRVDGFYINHSTQKAYIVDSQGPIYADQGL